MCNFSVTYFFPMWFQTVMLTSASTAGNVLFSVSFHFASRIDDVYVGLHLLPNSMSMSTGSLFAGWMMHKTGKYKMINLILGCLPFIGATLITKMTRDSGPIQMWLSIVSSCYS